jgi:lysophospholipase L1-like esterase
MKKTTVMKVLPAFFAVAFAIMAFIPQQKPTLYLIGDSTMRNGLRPMCGWGEVADQVFDTTSLHISNQAMAGRCTRQYLSEGRWDKVLASIRPGDYLIMAWGHNEGLDTTRGVGVLPGTGDGQIFMTRGGKKVEIRSYGWYLNKFTTEAQAKGAKVIIASMIPRNEFRKNAAGQDTVMRANKDYALWSQQIAEKTGAYFVDLNKITSDKYDKLGPVNTKKIFPGDHTHTNTDGAIINAQSVAEGIKMQPAIGLNAFLKPFGPHQVHE